MSPKEDIMKGFDDEAKTKLNHETTPQKDVENGTKNRRKFNYLTLLKYSSLIVLVVQNTSQVLIMRYASTRNQKPFLKTAAVFFNEVIKCITALILFLISSESFEKALLGLKEHFIDNFLDTLKVGVPAFIYTIQNFLLYVAIEHLDAGTYMVTYQLKILTTAFFTVIMMKRRLSFFQWVSLFILVAGIIVVQYSANQDKQEKKINSIIVNNASFVSSTPLFNSTSLKTMEIANKKHEHYQNPLIGLFAVITACFLSGFAGIYFEKILKGSEVSLWLRNVQLASLSIPIGMVVMAVKDGDRIYNDGLMQGFDIIVWIVVIMQAVGGLVVAVVIKYADNILKAFATSIAIVASCVASIFFFQIYPKLLFVGGAALVILAVVIYGIFPPKSTPSGMKNKMEENGAILIEQETLNVKY